MRALTGGVNRAADVMLARTAQRTVANDKTLFGRTAPKAVTKWRTAIASCGFRNLRNARARDQQVSSRPSKFTAESITSLSVEPEIRNVERSVISTPSH
jgi:hypothetical protein